MDMCDTQPNIAHTRIPTGKTGKLSLVASGLAVIAAAFLFSAIVGSRPASAEAVCGAHNEILANLEKIHSERPQAIGLSADGKLFEALVSPSGSWSILVNHPNRQTCVVAIGESWTSLPAVATDPST